MQIIDKFRLSNNLILEYQKIIYLLDNTLTLNQKWIEVNGDSRGT